MKLKEYPVLTGRCDSVELISPAAQKENTYSTLRPSQQRRCQPPQDSAIEVGAGRSMSGWRAPAAFKARNSFIYNVRNTASNEKSMRFKRIMKKRGILLATDATQHSRCLHDSSTR